jgi:hypothetical protein
VRESQQVPPPPEPEPITRLEAGIWYVDLDRIADDDLDGALADLTEAKAIVFDFRGYPRRLSSRKMFGHLITEPVQSARWCIPHVLLPDRRDMTCPEVGRWHLQPMAPHLDAKLVFITDGRAISYAESCLAIIEHYRLGEIVGERTAGTNGNVNPFTVPGWMTISWTGMKVLRHDGGEHHGVGIRRRCRSRRRSPACAPAGMNCASWRSSWHAPHADSRASLAPALPARFAVRRASRCARMRKLWTGGANDGHRPFEAR